MNIFCPHCESSTIRKNGSIHSGKQKYECLSCHKQFIEDPQNKTIPDDTKERIRRSLLECVSLEGICRIFDILVPLENTNFERVKTPLVRRSEITQYL